MRSGLAEMLKHGLIYDQEYWEQFLDLKAIDFADFDPLIYRSIEIKNEIVMQDPTEKNIRKALNFGHTLGHAIESYFLENDTKIHFIARRSYSGRVLESFISLHKNLINQEEYFQIKSTIKSIYGIIVLMKMILNPS
jgi:3-dehydroquinate synthase